MDNDNSRFIQLAHPHSWMLVAENLHQQALEIRKNAGTSFLVRYESGRRQSKWDETWRSTFLLSGFALENALKAFLVYENPEWISNGRLSKKLKSHDLVRLHGQSTTIPYKTKLLWVLAAFSSGLESWARYPCGLNSEETEEVMPLDEALWLGYCKLMQSYGRNMKLMLRRGWKGPNGDQWGNFDIGENFFVFPSKK